MTSRQSTQKPKITLFALVLSCFFCLGYSSFLFGQSQFEQGQGAIELTLVSGESALETANFQYSNSRWASYRTDVSNELSDFITLSQRVTSSSRSSTQVEMSLAISIPDDTGSGILAGTINVQKRSWWSWRRAWSTEASLPVTVMVEAQTPIVTDTVPPVISLIGENPLITNVGAAFVDPGVTALDNMDGNITSLVFTGGDSVNTEIAGFYTINYSVMDGAGNAAEPLSRIVEVVGPASVSLSSPTPVIEAKVGEAASVNITVEFNNPNIEFASDVRLTQSVVSDNDAVLMPELPIEFSNLSESVSIPFNQSVVSDSPGEVSVRYTAEIVGTASSATTTVILNYSEEATPIEEPVPPATVSFGIVGDSNSDEYQFNDKRGNSFHDVTFNWMELLSELRDLDFGSVGNRSRPRRAGYAYNWSLSGATASSLLSRGQHTGLAQQIADGSVTHALVWIGANDFHVVNGPYADIYSGRLSGASLQRKLDSFVADVTTAMTTLSQAGPAGLVVVDVIDLGFATPIKDLYPIAAFRQRVSNVIEEVNARIAIEAANLGAHVVDQTGILEAIYAQRNSDGKLLVAGFPLDLDNPSDNPASAELVDGHAGTILSGIYANEFFIKPFNSSYGVGIELLEHEKLLEAVGLR